MHLMLIPQPQEQGNNTSVLVTLQQWNSPCSCIHSFTRLVSIVDEVVVLGYTKQAFAISPTFPGGEPILHGSLTITRKGFRRTHAVLVSIICWDRIIRSINGLQGRRRVRGLHLF